MSVQPLTSAPRYRRRKGHVDPKLVARYRSDERQLRDALAAWTPGETLAVSRRRHAQINRCFFAAAASAQQVYDAVVEALGGGRAAVNTPEAQAWDRIVNGIRTAWEAHRMLVSDEHGVLVPSAVRIGSRAAYGPHQTGMEFEPPEADDPLADPTTGVALRQTVDAASAGAIPASGGTTHEVVSGDTQAEPRLDAQRLDTERRLGQVEQPG